MRKPLLLTLTSLLAVAHPQGERPRVGERAEGMAQAGPVLLQIRIQRLQEAMALPDDKARAIGERWARYDLDFLQKTKEMNRLRGRFNEILRGPGSEEDKGGRLKPLLDQFMELRRQQQDLKARFEEDVRAGLTPTQQVRLILLVDEIQQKLREGLREAARENRLNRRLP